MTKINPAIRTMTVDEAIGYGCYQGSLMRHECVSYRLSAGNSDDLHIFKSGVVLYVLTVNVKQTYIGLNVFMSQTEDAIDNIFLQGNDTISEFLGHGWRSLSLAQLVTRLMTIFA